MPIYGSNSGAVLNEKIPWGELGTDMPKYIIEVDAAIVTPLVFAYVLGWQQAGRTTLPRSAEIRDAQSPCSYAMVCIGGIHPRSIF